MDTREYTRGNFPDNRTALDAVPDFGLHLVLIWILGTLDATLIIFTASALLSGPGQALATSYFALVPRAILLVVLSITSASLLRKMQWPPAPIAGRLAIGAILLPIPLASLAIFITVSRATARAFRTAGLGASITGLDQNDLDRLKALAEEPDPRKDPFNPDAR